MSTSFEDFNTYSFIAINPDGTPHSEVLPDKKIETASSIKSPMANVALRYAERRGIDSETYTMTVGQDHVPDNATTFMRDKVGKSFNLEEIVQRTIVESDATATNMLIDFIGGREEVNKGLGHLGLDATELLQEKLDIEELQEPDPNPIFGASTVRQLAEYHRALMTNPDERPWTRKFIGWHELLKNVRLFATKADFLQPGVSFFHKTGSIFSMDIPQATMVDAGKLTVPGSFPEGKFVAGAFTVYREGGLSGINTEFSEKNLEQLGIERSDVTNHDLPKRSR